MYWFINRPESSNVVSRVFNKFLNEIIVSSIPQNEILMLFEVGERHYWDVTT